MRWVVKEKRKIATGEKRTVTRFLFLPKCLERSDEDYTKEWRWLERATWCEVYVGNFHPIMEWKPLYWKD